MRIQRLSPVIAVTEHATDAFINFSMPKYLLFDRWMFPAVARLLAPLRSVRPPVVFRRRTVFTSVGIRYLDIVYVGLNRYCSH